MIENVVGRLLADVSEEHLIAIANAISNACRVSAQAVRARYRADYPTGHILGQERYHDIQNALLDLRLQGVTCRSERHPNGSTFFTAIESRDARLTTRKVEFRAELAPPTLFREHEQALQLSFDFRKIVAEVQIVMGDGDAPRYIDVRFPDGNGSYIDEFIDIIALQSKPIPEEHIDDKRTAKPRPSHELPKKDSVEHKQNDRS